MKKFKKTFKPTHRVRRKMRFLKHMPKLVVAAQWFKQGDLAIYGHNDHDGLCPKCKISLFWTHGYLRNSNGGSPVCPKNWILTDKDNKTKVVETYVLGSVYERI